MARGRKETVSTVSPISVPAEPVTRPAPAAPSFGLCEGVRTDLELAGESVDPFTGRRVTK